MEIGNLIIKIFIKSYPKTYYEPFGIEMFLRKNKTGKEIIVTESSNDIDIRNIINLYLEVFGYCEILDENLNSLLLQLLIMTINQIPSLSIPIYFCN